MTGVSAEGFRIWPSTDHPPEIIAGAQRQLDKSKRSEPIATSDGKAYNCKDEDKGSLCRLGNLVTRLIGVRMKSTGRINDKEYDIQRLQDIIDKADKDHPVVL